MTEPSTTGPTTAEGLPDLLHPLHLHERAAADPGGSATRSHLSDPPGDFDRDPCAWYWQGPPPTSRTSTGSGTGSRVSGTAMETRDRHRRRGRSRQSDRRGARGRERAVAGCDLSWISMSATEAVDAGVGAGLIEDLGGLRRRGRANAASSTRSTARSRSRSRGVESRTSRPTDRAVQHRSAPRSRRCRSPATAAAV